MKILSLCVENFRSIERVELEFPDEGNVYVITGKNLDVPNVCSNGSGKTSLMGAIFYSLFNQSIWKSSIESLYREGKFSPKIKLKFSLDGKICDLVKEPRQMKIQLNGETLNFDTFKDAQKFLQQFVGMTPKNFSKSVFVTEDWESFVDQMPYERIQTLTELFGLNVFLSGSKKASDNSKKTERKLQAVRENKTFILGSLKEIEDIDLLPKIEEFEQKRAERIRSLKEQKKMILSQIDLEAKKLDELKKRIAEREEESKTNRLNSLKKKLDEYRRRYDKVTSELQKAHSDLNVIAENIKRIQNEMDSFKEGYCITCKRPVDDIVIEKVLGPLRRTKKELDDKFDELKRKFERLQEEQNSLGGRMEKTREEYEKELEKSLSLKSLKRELKKKVEDLNWNVEQWRKQLDMINEQLEEYENADNPFEKQNLEREKKIRSYKLKVVKLEEEEEVLMDAKECYDFWATGFKTIHVRLFEKFLDDFSFLVNDYLSRLDFPYELRFVTEKSKSNLEKIELLFDNLSFKELSAGEKQLVRLACAFATSDLLQLKVGKKYNLLVLDEPLKGLDKTKQELFANLLLDFTEKGKQIFVISHSQDFSEKFANRICLVKSNGKTVLEDFYVGG